MYHCTHFGSSELRVKSPKNSAMNHKLSWMSENVMLKATADPCQFFLLQYSIEASPYEPSLRKKNLREHVTYSGVSPNTPWRILISRNGSILEKSEGPISSASSIVCSFINEWNSCRVRVSRFMCWLKTH